MLVGSAPVGALRVGDAPYPTPFIVPPPALRTPSGHNIFVSPSPPNPPTNIFFGVLPEVPAQVGEPGVTLYFSVGGPPSLTAGITLTVTQPSGASYTAAPALVYIGKQPVTSPRGSFQGATYLVYTFAEGELDELGPWTVAAKIGSVTSPPGCFTVVRNVGI